MDSLIDNIINLFFSLSQPLRVSVNMPKLRELAAQSIVAQTNQQKAYDNAIILITIALYLLTAGTLMEYVSIPTLLKTIGLMLSAHAFYFLWKSHLLTH
jgi:hypothetical protein